MSLRVWSPYSHRAILLLALLLPLPAFASGTLHCPAGDVPCLIDAILQANEREETTLILDAGVYTLQEPDPESFLEGATAFPIITSTLTIQGQGAAQTLLTRDPTSPLFRLFAVAETGVLTLERLTLAGGAVRIDWGERGGGILNFGTLRLEQAVLRNHSAWIGGAIDNDGVLESDTSSLSDNFADFVAAGVATAGPTTITRSLLSGNISEIDAAASWDPRAGVVEFHQSWIDGNLATLTGAGGVGGTGQALLVETIVSGNLSAVWAGGIFSRGQESVVTLRRSAVIGNSAMFAGGGIVLDRGLLRLQESQVVGNVAGLGIAGRAAGIENRGGVVRARNSTILGNRATTAPDCQGELITVGSTVVGNPQGCTIAQR